MAEWAANNSLSKVEYFSCAGDNFLEKKASGDHPPFWNCCKTPPTCEFEASTAREIEAPGAGCERGTTDRREALAASKAAAASADHNKTLGLPLRRSVRGCRIFAMEGRNCL
jgi:hypothetical protein